MLLPVAPIYRYMTSDGVSITYAEIERLWDLYRAALLDNGFAPYIKALGYQSWGQVFNFLVGLGYAKYTVASFLNALERVSLVDGYGIKWVDPVGAADALKKDVQSLAATVETVFEPVKAAVKTVADAAQPLLDPVTKVVKYAAIAAVVAGGAYILFNLKRSGVT